MDTPEWFRLGEPLMWTFPEFAIRAVDRLDDTNLRVSSMCAGYHLIDCLNASIRLNEKGRHSVAISVFRQCIEAITVLEFGLIDEARGAELFTKWKKGERQGSLRNELEENVWSTYGPGIWEESWSEYFASFAKAVQDYSHYGYELQAWQMIVENKGRMQQLPSGMLKAHLRPNIGSYDASKATRITLLHVLTSWTVGRILRANSHLNRKQQDQLDELHEALAESTLAEFAKRDWAHHFYALEFNSIEPDST
jgi:hypothetical protein